jgi:ABC-type branched-subunit amino acid transport system substrate-binding protein
MGGVMRTGWMIGLVAAAMLAVAAGPALAQKKYDNGASDTEIKIGGSGPFSGPASVAGQLVKSVGAYFAMVNAKGGINGRKITYMAEDDTYSPAKAVEVTRKLVEQDGVLLMAGAIGTPTQLAVQGYLNAKQIPQLFIATGNSAFYDAKNHPWTIGNSVTTMTEGVLIGKHVAQNWPGAKVAILYQNDDLGKEYLAGVKQGIGDKATIASAVSYEISDATVDSQIATLQSSGATIFVSLSTPKATSQAIRRAYDTDWKPKIIIPSIVAQIQGTLAPAGLDKSVGVMTPTFIKDANDPRWANDPATKEFLAWMKEYDTGVSDTALAIAGYDSANTLASILQACGNDLTRENVMKHAASLTAYHPPMMLPGISVTTTPTDYHVIHQMQFQRFNGTNWELYGDVVSDKD